MALAVDLDPLGPSADPRHYVALDSSERALGDLHASIQAGLSPVLLEGASGLGKTLLLRVLADREACCGRHVVFSPFLHLPPDDVAPWLLHLLRSPVGKGALDDQVLAALRADELLLIVDEIQSAPEESARRLVALAQAAGPPLVLVVAGRRARELAALIPALSPAVTVSLPDRLSAWEMRALYDALLEHPELDPAVRSVGVGEREDLVRLARGVPAVLKGDLFRATARHAVSRVLAEEHGHAAPDGAAAQSEAGEEASSAPAALEPPPERADLSGVSAPSLAPVSPAPARARRSEWRPAVRAEWRAAAAATARTATQRASVRWNANRELAVRWATALAIRGRAFSRRGALGALRLLERASAFAAARASEVRAALVPRARDVLARIGEESHALSQTAGAACARVLEIPVRDLSRRGAFGALLLAERIRARAAARASKARAALVPQAREVLGRIREVSLALHQIVGAACTRVLGTPGRDLARRGAVDALRLVERFRAQAAVQASSARAGLAPRTREVLGRAEAEALALILVGGAAARSAASSAGPAAAWAFARARAAVQRERRDVAPLAARAGEGAADSGRRMAARLAAQLRAIPRRRHEASRSAWPVLVATLLLALLAVRLHAPAEQSAATPPREPAILAPIRVHVNARPWAVIRVDGVEVGTTPLSHLRLTPGPHEFEAEFSDGRTVRRRIEIGPERTTVALAPARGARE